MGTEESCPAKSCRRTERTTAGSDQMLHNGADQTCRIRSERGKSGFGNGIKFMKIKNLDHLVITTKNIDACLHFYVDILGMKCDKSNGRYAVYFGDHNNQKFNIHTRKAEFLPAAANPTYGSLDLCLAVEENIYSVKQELEDKGCPIEEGPVIRHGAMGEMTSIYLRDPDGNLVELCN